MDRHSLASPDSTLWPPLPLEEWEPTYETVRRWAQVLGKVRTALTPPVNHWWHSSLRVTEWGLSTGPVPHGGRRFSLELSFATHRLVLRTDEGWEGGFDLVPMTVAEFHRRTMEVLAVRNLDVRINPAPQELGDVTPLDRDTRHVSYDPDATARLLRILRSVDKVFQETAWGFLGKQSPSHFFWGAFDLAVTRFSGRRNPVPPADPVMGEAYSHEVISHGFWPGGDWPVGGRVGEAVFYAYAVPSPEGFAGARVEPPQASWSAALGEFLLPYDAVRTAPDPRGALLAFMRSTYEAAADAAGWDRAALERQD